MILKEINKTIKEYKTKAAEIKELEVKISNEEYIIKRKQEAINSLENKMTIPSKGNRIVNVISIYLFLVVFIISPI